MIKLSTLVENHKHEYGCVMLYYTFPEMEKIHESINPEELYIDNEDSSFGLENEPHTTLLFGLHDDVKTSDVKKIIDKHQYGECILHNASLFKNEKYDVLKFDVKYPTRGGEFLHKTNADLKKLPHTSSFPDYHPHTTIAYLKPGKGQKYVNSLKDKEYKLLPEYAVYSKPDGSKDKIEISVG